MHEWNAYVISACMGTTVIFIMNDSDSMCMGDKDPPRARILEFAYILVMGSKSGKSVDPETPCMLT